MPIWFFVSHRSLSLQVLGHCLELPVAGQLFYLTTSSSFMIFHGRALDSVQTSSCQRLCCVPDLGSRVEFLWCAPVSGPVAELFPGLIFVVVIWVPARAHRQFCTRSLLHFCRCCCRSLLLEKHCLGISVSRQSTSRFSLWSSLVPCFDFCCRWFPMYSWPTRSKSSRFSCSNCSQTGVFWTRS
jgi:hypothetical protein